MQFKSRPVLITFSILTGLQVITNAAGLGDVVPAPIIFLLGLIVAAIQAGMTFYVQGQVVPNAAVAAYLDNDGEVKAGPAASTPTGLIVAVEPTLRDERGAVDTRLWPVLIVVAIFVVVFVVLLT